MSGSRMEISSGRSLNQLATSLIVYDWFADALSSCNGCRIKD